MAAVPRLADVSVIAWLEENQIKNEKGDRIEFRDHLFQYDIYRDRSDNIAAMKPAQVGLSTLQVIKNHYDAKQEKLDIIYCVDMETEVLSRRGFVRGDRLTLDDEIITLDINGVAQWSAVEEVFRKRVRTEMYRYKARNFDAVATSNHRWIVQDRKGRLSFVESKHLRGGNRFIPKRIPNNPVVDARFPDYYVELLAWVFAEGYYCKQTGRKDWSIIICQSHLVNPDKCDEIRSLLRANGATWKEYTNWRNNTTNFRFAFDLGKRIKTEFPAKVPTAAFADSLTRSQCRLFIEAFVRGDGWIDRSGTLAIAQKNKECVDILAMIAALGGYSPSVVPPGKNGTSTIRMTQFATIYTDELRPTISDEEIEVWCPRTKQGTFYARRGGRYYWTGNTLPTDGDVNVFVSGKVNRIIANNPCMLEDVDDKDSIEQKQIGNSYEYFKGTWTAKAAIMITADRLVHDEIDSSKLSVVADYQARLQHSKKKQTHVFSHPSVPNKGVHQFFLMSDQKEWFVKCPHCKVESFMEWNTEDPKHMSVDLVKKEFICKKCGGVLTNEARAFGRWVPKKFKVRPKWSGYHVSLLMAPWVTAKEIVDKYQECVDGKQTMDFFYNKVLGLPFAGGGNSVEEETVLGAVTEEANAYKGRLVIGVDTGIDLRYVIGNKQGLVGFGQMKDYMPDAVNNLTLNETLEYFLKKFPNSIMVVDQGGDIIGSRKLRSAYPGRVFLCHYAADRKTMQLIRWGEKDESGNVLADRNRMIQLVADELRDKRLKLYNGTRADWHDYWLHWSHIYRTWKEDTLGVPRYTWMRDGRDDWVHATVYWRIGISRFGEGGSIVGVSEKPEANSYMVNANRTASFDPKEFFKLGEGLSTDDEDDGEWR